MLPRAQTCKETRHDVENGYTFRYHRENLRAVECVSIPSLRRIYTFYVKKQRQNPHSSYASNIQKKTYCLFADVVIGAHEKTHEDGDGAFLDNDTRVLTGAASDVGQCPRGFELQSRVVISLEEFHKLRNHASVNHVLDGRVAFCSAQWNRNILLYFVCHKLKTHPKEHLVSGAILGCEDVKW